MCAQIIREKPRLVLIGTLPQKQRAAWKNRRASPPFSPALPPQTTTHDAPVHGFVK
jgi:hypothetical protein